MTDLKKNLKICSGLTKSGLPSHKQTIYSGLNLLSESETNSLKLFLKEKVALSNKRNGVKPLTGS